MGLRSPDRERSPRYRLGGSSSRREALLRAFAPWSAADRAAVLAEGFWNLIPPEACPQRTPTQPGRESPAPAPSSAARQAAPTRPAKVVDAEHPRPGAGVHAGREHDARRVPRGRVRLDAAGGRQLGRIAMSNVVSKQERGVRNAPNSPLLLSQHPDSNRGPADYEFSREEPDFRDLRHGGDRTQAGRRRCWPEPRAIREERRPRLAAIKPGRRTSGWPAPARRAGAGGSPCPSAPGGSRASPPPPPRRPRGSPADRS